MSVFRSVSRRLSFCAFLSSADVVPFVGGLGGGPWGVSMVGVHGGGYCVLCPVRSRLLPVQLPA